MNIGINTACLQKHSAIKPREIIDKVRMEGFSGIEFRDEYPFFEEVNSNEGRYINDVVKGEGLLCSVHLSFYDLNPGSFRKDLRDKAVECHSKAIRKAAEIGASMVTIHGGKMSNSFYDSESCSEVDRLSSESIGRIREICEDEGITLCVENMSCFDRKEYKSFTRPEDLIWLHEEQDEKIRVTLDIGHVVSITPDIVEYITRLGSRKIGLCHLSDNNLIRDQHLAVGQGNIDYEGLMRTYMREDWNFPLFIETTNFAQTLESKRYLESLVQNIAVG
ncbi:MAG: sugar phosphate isomerase/epimerase [Spirochaetales bacterium]|nr:sugar phosphate isomerase/epimerase [Spirochaetales bacterium]